MNTWGKGHKWGEALRILSRRLSRLNEKNAPAFAFYSWLSSHDTCAYAANGTGWDVERVDAWYDKTGNSGRPGNFNKTLAGQRKHILAEGFLMLLVPLLRRRWALALLRRRLLWC